MKNEQAQDVLDAVEEDFTLHYRVVDTNEFLNRLVPVEPSIVEKILQKMKNKGLYSSKTKRWTKFPNPSQQKSEKKEEPGNKPKLPQEKYLYGPFRDMAEAIREAAEGIRGPMP